MVLNHTGIEEQNHIMIKLLDSPIAKFITLGANDCGYSGTAEELIVDYVYPLFLAAKASTSKEDNPNWSQATTVQFAN